MPPEVKVMRGRWKGHNGRVVGIHQTGHGPFYVIHFFNNNGELTAPPTRDMVNAAMCKVVIA
jgi:hypothetical protein